MLEIKSVVDCFKARHLTLAAYLCICLGMLGEVQLIRELKLGEANHDRMRKKIKICMHDRRHISQGDLPITKEGGYHFKLASRI
jgi:hypothetical protein